MTPADDPDLSELLGRLKDDTVRVVRAEVEVRRARLNRASSIIRIGSIYGVAAGLIAYAALIGLVVGLVITLIPVVGPLAATAIVVGTTLVIAAVLGWIAYGHFKRLGGPR